MAAFFGKKMVIFMSVPAYTEGVANQLSIDIFA